MTPEDEGARSGDVIRLVVAGQELATATWTAHGALLQTPLGQPATPRRLYLPLLRRSAPWQGRPPAYQQWLPLVAGEDG